MDAALFDRLTKSLSDADTRRRLLQFVTSVTVGGALDLLLDNPGVGARGNGAGIGGGHRRRRKRRHKNGKRRRGKHRNLQTCKSKAQVCAGKCGHVTYKCKKLKQTVDCGSCTCNPPCGECLICSETTRVCEVDPNQRGEDCGEPGQVCQADGSCACSATSCAGTAPICVDGVCTTCSAAHPCANGCCAADGSCQPGDTVAACGPVGGSCDVCTGDELCDAAHVCTAPVRCGSPGAVCRVFATSAMRRGKLGGLNGADQFCQELATSAGLPGTYKAWLSDATDAPSTRFTHAQGPYQLIDGTVIADNWSDLISGSLDHAINRDEHGDPLSDPDGRIDVWTATSPSGTRDTSDGVTADCNNWSSSEIFYRGGLGSSSLADQRWTVAGFASNCAIRSRLYCFQQS